MHYQYAYIVNVYGGTETSFAHYLKRIESLQWHLRFLKNYHVLAKKDKSVLFIVRQAGPNISYSQAVQEILDQNKCDWVDSRLIVRKNWGMTPGALWDGYRYMRDEGLSSDYVIDICDDWLFNHWPQHQALLDTRGYDCVGHFSAMIDDGPEGKYSNWCQLGYKVGEADLADPRVLDYLKLCGAPPEMNMRRWTDGAGYFTRFDILIKMEEAMKPHRFSLAPYDETSPSLKINTTTLNQDPQYIFYEHGIFYGEVGMPTHMWARGFKHKAYREESYISGRRAWIDVSQSGDVRYAGDQKFLNDDRWVHDPPYAIERNWIPNDPRECL